jgi:hypothetical protein
MTTTVTIDQLRNLADRAGTGLTPSEQQRLREGIDALHAERADAWQKFATVAAQRDRLRIRMNALADRWEHALGVDKPYARALRAEISIELFGTDDTPSPAPTTTPPTPAHTHIWDGGNLPDWLQLDDYHFDNNQLVIYTPDSPTRPQPGWSLIRWTDNTITVASPTVAERVYGPDGIAGRLARAQAATDGELRRQLDAAICALGRSETELARLRADIAICRAQQWPQRLGKAEKRLARVQRLLDSGPIGTCCNHLLRAALSTRPADDDARPTRHVHVTIRHPDVDTVNRAALSLVGFLRDHFPAHHVTTDAGEWEQPPAATQATERDCLFRRDGGRPCNASDSCATCDPKEQP